MHLRPLATLALLVALAPSPAAAAPADSLAKRLQDALDIKARLERTLADRLAAAPAADSAAPAAAHGAPARAKPAAPAASAKPAHAAAPAPAAAPPADTWDELLAGNRRFLTGRPRVRPLLEQRAALAAGQHPRAIVLACADSRVPPELLFDQSLGDLFVVRVAGNIADSAGIGSIEYAVEHLHTRTLVVLGHTGCGAVKAAAAGGDPGSPNLGALVAHIEPVVRRLSNCFEGEELVERAVTANARACAVELLERSAMLRHAREADGLRVVAAVYDLDTGRVKELR